jgi:cytoskeletal protein CcmA (bactofilin family)
MVLKIPYSIDDFIVKTWCKKDVYLKGDLHFSTSLRIDGNLDGNIYSDNGFLIVSHTSTVRGDIKAGVIMIAGKVFGNISASKKVELFSGAEVIGSIRAPVFRMEDNVKFEGECDTFEDYEEVGVKHG